MPGMRRREFVSAARRRGGGVAARGARAAAADAGDRLSWPRLGCGECADARMFFARVWPKRGYVEGRNVAIEYRFAEGQYDRLPEMAAELVRREVSVIVATGGTGPALAAKAATATIPIVFGVTNDPVALGLVVSFARPGGNATGVNFPLAEVAVKELGLLHELVPAARRIGLLVNPNNSASAAVI